MRDLEKIKQQIKGIDGLGAFLGRKEIKELPNILMEDENVLKIIQGTYNNGNGILVATEKRLIFIDKGMFFGLKVEDFPFERITSTQYQTGIILGKLTIFASGNRAVIDNVPNQQVRGFGDWLRTRLSEKDSPAPKAAAAPDRLEQLEKLLTLKEKGALTEEEFKAEKAKLLNQQ